MNKIGINKSIVVWLLLAIFAMPFITRTVHIESTDCHGTHCTSHTEDEHNTEHDCNTCPVCQFSLSSFTEINFPVSGNVSATFCSTIFIPYQEKIYTSTTHSNSLRAPPLF